MTRACARIAVVALALALTACFNLPSAQEKAQMDQQKQDYCQNLARQIREARGKPLRRSTLERRYQQECCRPAGCVEK
ncbi:MAG TPA: hypothetical protein VFA95_08355 [Gammaproteobacteria bacterium]|nr:hypothetical protein [Gammaproteobacteria bacterium]